MPLPWSVRGGLFEIHPNDSGQLFPASPPGRTAGRQQQQQEEEKEKETRWSPRTRMQTRSKSYICPNDTLVGHSCGSLLWDTLVGHSYGTLLWGTLVGRSCRILFWVTLVGSSKLLRGTLDATNHPAHQRHAAFTPACFALPSGAAPRKRTFHQGRANPNGAATSRPYHTIPQIIPLTSDTPRLHQPVSRSPVARRHFPPRPCKSQWHCNITNVTSPHGLPIHYKQTHHMIPEIIRSPATRRVYTSMFRASRANPNGAATSRTSCRRTVCLYTRSKHVT